jgi:hypothetical protein
MEWLYGFVEFIAAICTIFGVSFASLLKKVTSSQQPEVSVPAKSIPLYEWIKIFRQGLVDTSDYFLKDVRLFSSWNDTMISGDNPIMVGPVGSCSCLFAAIISVGTVCLGLPIIIVISLFGWYQGPPATDLGSTINDLLMLILIGALIGVAIMGILLFIWFSLIYVEKVGPAIEKIKSEYHQELVNQQEMQ